MDKVVQILSIQEERFEQITKAQTNFHKAGKSKITLSYIETRMETLEKVWQLYKQSHEQLIAFVNRDQRTAYPYFKEDFYDQCEEIYINYKSELKEKLRALTPKEAPQQPSASEQKTNTEIKLPTINLPTFSGKYTDWPSFHDLFSSIIHNNKALDDVQKLHYLKSSLAGEAEQLLRSVSITSQNYDLAWKTLTNRYNNKRYISNCVFKKLFGMRNITSESSYTIKQLLDTTVECLNSLNNLGLPTKSWDAIIIYMTVSKLDGESHRLWEQHISEERADFPTFASLKNFLETRFKSLEMLEQSHKATSSRHKTFHAAVEPVSCTFCKEDHYIYQCKQFAKQTYKDRHEFVQNNNLCFNCLIPNHSALKCKRETSCRICKKNHHSLLHPEKKDSVSDDCHKDSRQNIVSHFVNQPGQILLATALVDVTSRQGSKHVYRALIDQGSQASFVSEDLVQTMGLKRVKINGVVSGLSEGNTLQTKYMVEVQLKSRHNTNFTVLVKAYVLKAITNYLPTQQVTVSNWPEFETLELADPGFGIPDKIHLLLGAEVYGKIIDTGLLKSPTGIIAQRTHLGWILSGDTSDIQPVKQKQIISMHVCVCENEILRKFWEIENETLTSERKLTKEEEKCENIYKETTIRTETGRYKVHLPFKEDIETPVEKCGKTKDIATSRFLQLERKFKHDTKLKEEYRRVIHEYQELGHMTLAEDNEEDVLYLPHHAVIRNDKDTTKVRVVYDASASGSKGCSLNDTLLTGPVIQKDLRTLIIQWRQHKIAIISDIVKMYRQVLIADKHADYQRILWRDNPHENCKSYKLLTVTFGTASAPYLAIRTLMQVAEDEHNNYPVGSEVVKNCFYVDDLMTGSYNVEHALEIYEQVNKILNSAGFELQKWSSNSEEFLDKIHENKDEIQTFEIKLDKVIKILGLSWDREDDKFKFKVELPEKPKTITKRNVLSEVARLFDPFGWLSPAIVKAKILIQRLWLCTSGWDEQLPENLQEEWVSFRKQLNELKNIHIDRWLFTHPDNEQVELHGFADASASAYAAVLYVKTIQNNEVHVTILESKTKVAPLKQISIARLELCAAVLLAKLLSEATNVLKIPKDQVYAYTDSMVVLAWIEAQPTKWQTFVANRVSEIQNRINNDRWNHVISEDNPADLASRGVNPAELKDKEIWWKGPKWLQEKTVEQKTKTVPKTNLEEKKQQVKSFFGKDEDKPIWERFSTLNKMIRVLTYCRRFLHLKEKKKDKQMKNGYLTSEEMKKTLENCIKICQEKEFGEEINDLKDKGQIKKRSKLRTLSPYLDKGLLRVGGRLQAAKLAQEYKHPIIIPNNTHLTTLIVRDAHMKLLHGGIALTMNLLRSRYWIIGLKSLVKKCFRECVVCTRFKATTTQPQMGELPRVRVNPGRPFEESGVDFGGPIQMRCSKGRGQKSFKGYIALFICMKTRAIHLEAVSDLTSQGFIAAYRRFVSRRGHCAELWSDNGLNFVGAAKELSQMLNQSMTNVLEEVAELLANDGTKWNFIPPRAPNFGGLWEAGIKSVKTHIVKTIGDSTLTFEEMTTLLSQIEACLNSRPICQMNDHPDDVTPLTPAHFLVGEPLIVLPEKHDIKEAISPLNRWRLVQRMMTHFWNRWSKEFLHTMQQRHKWYIKTAAPRIGDVVIIKDNDLPPTKWLLARITEVHMGPDNEVRVVTLKTKTTTLKRPLSKLILLPRELNKPVDG